MENNSSIKKNIWISIILVVIVGMFFGIFYKDIIGFLNKRETAPIIPERNTEVPSRLVLATLESRVSFPKKEIISTKESNVVELGKVLSTLILTDASSQRISKQEFSDGTNGWEISYTNNEDVKNTYNKLYSLSNRGDFKVTFSSRSTNAALTLSETSKYKIKIATKFIDEKSSEVLINIVE
jgi:hypothetical protein